MITIIGAGLGGLTLASVLHRHGIEVQVFDRDRSAAERRQGGMLDLHAESGQAALRAAGLFEAFQALVLEGGDGTRVLDPTGKVWIDQPGDGARPEVDRSRLRQLLLSSLPPKRIHWGAKAGAVRRIGSDAYEVVFADGRSVTTDLLIGADGARSSIRPMLSKAVPVYSGVSFVETRIHDAPQCHPELSALVGPGSMFALAEGRGLFTHREPGGSICVYVALRTPANWTATAQITRASVLAQFSDWDPALRRLIGASDGDLIARPVYALPIGHRWDPQAGITLIGDAAHLMSPFAGEGANLAMQDGAELAQAIIAHPENREAALTQFEPAMFARSEAAAAESAAGLERCLGAAAPWGLIEFFSARPV